MPQAYPPLVTHSWRPGRPTIPSTPATHTPRARSPAPAAHTPTARPPSPPSSTSPTPSYPHRTPSKDNIPLPQRSAPGNLPPQGPPEFWTPTELSAHILARPRAEFRDPPALAAFVLTHACTLPGLAGLSRGDIERLARGQKSLERDLRLLIDRARLQLRCPAKTRAPALRGAFPHLVIPRAEPVCRRTREVEVERDDAVSVDSFVFSSSSDAEESGSSAHKATATRGDVGRAASSASGTGHTSPPAAASSTRDADGQAGSASASVGASRRFEENVVQPESNGMAKPPSASASTLTSTPSASASPALGAQTKITTSAPAAAADKQAESTPSSNATAKDPAQAKNGGASRLGSSATAEAFPATAPEGPASPSAAPEGDASPSAAPEGASGRPASSSQRALRTDPAAVTGLDRDATASPNRSGATATAAAAAAAAAPPSSGADEDEHANGITAIRAEHGAPPGGHARGATGRGARSRDAAAVALPLVIPIPASGARDGGAASRSLPTPPDETGGAGAMPAGAKPRGTGRARERMGDKEKGAGEEERGQAENMRVHVEGAADAGPVSLPLAAHHLASDEAGNAGTAVEREGGGDAAACAMRGSLTASLAIGGIGVGVLHEDVVEEMKAKLAGCSPAAEGTEEKNDGGGATSREDAPTLVGAVGPVVGQEAPVPAQDANSNAEPDAGNAEAERVDTAAGQAVMQGTSSDPSVEPYSMPRIDDPSSMHTSTSRESVANPAVVSQTPTVSAASPELSTETSGRNNGASASDEDRPANHANVNTKPDGMRSASADAEAPAASGSTAYEKRIDVIIPPPSDATARDRGSPLQTDAGTAKPRLSLAERLASAAARGPPDRASARSTERRSSSAVAAAGRGMPGASTASTVRGPPSLPERNPRRATAAEAASVTGAERGAQDGVRARESSQWEGCRRNAQSTGEPSPSSSTLERKTEASAARRDRTSRASDVQRTVSRDGAPVPATAHRQTKDDGAFAPADSVDIISLQSEKTNVIASGSARETAGEQGAQPHAADLMPSDKVEDDTAKLKNQTAVVADTKRPEGADVQPSASQAETSNDLTEASRSEKPVEREVLAAHAQSSRSVDEQAALESANASQCGPAVDPVLSQGTGTMPGPSKSEEVAAANENRSTGSSAQKEHMDATSPQMDPNAGSATNVESSRDRTSSATTTRTTAGYTDRTVLTSPTSPSVQRTESRPSSGEERFATPSDSTAVIPGAGETHADSLPLEEETMVTTVNATGDSAAATAHEPSQHAAVGPEARPISSQRPSGQRNPRSPDKRPNHPESSDKVPSRDNARPLPGANIHRQTTVAACSSFAEISVCPTSDREERSSSPPSTIVSTGVAIHGQDAMTALSQASGAQLSAMSEHVSVHAQNSDALASAGVMTSGPARSELSNQPSNQEMEEIKVEAEGMRASESSSCDGTQDAQWRAISSVGGRTAHHAADGAEDGYAATDLSHTDATETQIPGDGHVISSRSRSPNPSTIPTQVVGIMQHDEQSESESDGQYVSIQGEDAESGFFTSNEGDVDDSDDSDGYLRVSIDDHEDHPNDTPSHRSSSIASEASLGVIILDVGHDDEAEYASSQTEDEQEVEITPVQRSHGSTGSFTEVDITDDESGWEDGDAHGDFTAESEVLSSAPHHSRGGSELNTEESISALPAEEGHHLGGVPVPPPVMFPPLLPSSMRGSFAEFEMSDSSRVPVNDEAVAGSSTFNSMPVPITSSALSSPAQTMAFDGQAPWTPVSIHRPAINLEPRNTQRPRQDTERHTRSSSNVSTSSSEVRSPVRPRRPGQPIVQTGEARPSVRRSVTSPIAYDAGLPTPSPTIDDVSEIWLL